MAERIFEDYKEINENPNQNCGITIGLVNQDSYFDWQITLLGPKEQGNPYKGGLFILRAHFPPDYPNKPPEVYFITPIYHVNIKPTAPQKEGEESLGHVCISTLNWWKPEYKMKEVLLNIYSLFFMHNPDSAYGNERAKEYNENKDVYIEKAKYFTKKYASPFKQNTDYDRSQDWDFNLQ